MFELASCTSYPILSDRPLIASSKWIFVCSAGEIGSSPVPVHSSSCEWAREPSRRSEHREVILHSDAFHMHSSGLRCTQMHSTCTQDGLRCTQDGLRCIPHALKMDSDAFQMHSRWTHMHSRWTQMHLRWTRMRSPASRVKRREDDRAQRSGARRSAPMPQRQPSCPGGYTPCTPVNRYESHWSGGVPGLTLRWHSDGTQMALGWYPDGTRMVHRCLG